jgi:hypothetical protein
VLLEPLQCEVRTTKNLEQIVHESNLFVLYEQAQNPNTLSLPDPPNFGLKAVFCDPVVVPAS